MKIQLENQLTDKSNQITRLEKELNYMKEELAKKPEKSSEIDQPQTEEIIFKNTEEFKKQLEDKDNQIMMLSKQLNEVKNELITKLHESPNSEINPTQNDSKQDILELKKELEDMRSLLLEKERKI